jgi:hypothetical protein
MTLFAMAKSLNGFSAVTLIVSRTIASAAFGAERFQKLSGQQIRVRLAGMEITDEMHWRYIYDRDASLRAYSMGRNMRGKWSVEENEVCLDLERPDGGCFEMWLSGKNVKLIPPDHGCRSKLCCSPAGRPLTLSTRHVYPQHAERSRR